MLEYVGNAHMKGRPTIGIWAAMTYLEKHGKKVEWPDYKVSTIFPKLEIEKDVLKENRLRQYYNNRTLYGLRGPYFDTIITGVGITTR